MKSDIFNFDVKANDGPRNAFPIGYATLFSSPVGLLIPCYVEDVKSKDKLRLDVDSFTRTRPVNTAAFMAFDQKIDFWFVPYRLLWSAYNDWRLSQSFPKRSTDIRSVGNQYLLPHTTWSSINSFITNLPALSSPDSSDYWITPTAAHCLRMLDMLNYGAVAHSSYSTLSFSDSFITSGKPSSLANLFGDLCSSMQNSGLFFNYFRLAAFQCIYMHGYRNEEFEPLNPTFYNVDSLFSSSANANKLPTPINAPSGEYPTPTISLPYYLINGSIGPNNPLATNYDSINLRKLFTPRYKNWRKDLFTSLKPESGFDSATAPVIPSQLQPGGTGTSFDWSSGSASDFGQLTPPGFSNSTDTTARLANPSQVIPVSSNFAYLYARNIYQLLASDKFSRSMIYGNKSYKDQMRALFGVNVDEPSVPRYLGSFENTINISEIVATAAGSDGDPDASTSILGELAGKGIGREGRHCFESDFDEDGIVLGIHYIMPRNNYDSYRCSRFNTKVSRFDYFYPQFDGLGLQPYYVYERGLFTPFGTSGAAATQILNPTSLLGYGPRYAEYKTRQAETHGAFMTGQSDYDWTLSNNGFGVESASNILNYKIIPTITDRIFSVGYNGSIATDPFLCYMHFNVTRVSNLERIGVPSI